MVLHHTVSVLVTGFGYFDGVPAGGNPSATIATALSRTPFQTNGHRVSINENHLDRLEQITDIPVSEAGLEQFFARDNTSGYDAIVHLGYDESATRARVANLARNARTGTG